MFLGSGHRVTGEFRRSQIVTAVAAECIARMGVTTPCIISTYVKTTRSTRTGFNLQSVSREFYMYRTAPLLRPPLLQPTFRKKRGGA